MAFAAGSSYAGYADWRLPDLNELGSIVEYACYQPAIDEDVFPLSDYAEYWSSTQQVVTPEWAWQVNFADGRVHATKNDYFDRVRLVRGPELSPVFVKLDVAGDPLPVGAASWSCVEDSATGLVWEAKTDDGTLRDRDWTYTWLNTDPATNGGNQGSAGETGTSCLEPGRCNTEAYIADVNASGLCGAADWRLPTPHELRLIYDYYRTQNPASSQVLFPDTLSSAHWTSSTDADSVGNAWVVNFDVGATHNTEPLDKDLSSPLRLVRQRYSLSVTRTGNGGGLVTSDRPGILCGTDCRANFDPGASVRLTAEPMSCSRFVAWDGACSGTDPECVVAMTGAQTVVSSFAIIEDCLANRAGWRAAFEPDPEPVPKANAAQ